MTNIVTVSHLSFEYPDEHVVFNDLSLNVKQENGSLLLVKMVAVKVRWPN